MVTTSASTLVLCGGAVKHPGSSRSSPAVVAGYFEFLPNANFWFSSLIQASISLRLPASAHSPREPFSRFLNGPAAAGPAQLASPGIRRLSAREKQVRQRRFASFLTGQAPVALARIPATLRSCCSHVKTVPGGQSGSPDWLIWRLNGRRAASHILGLQPRLQPPSFKTGEGRPSGSLFVRRAAGLCGWFEIFAGRGS